MNKRHLFGLITIIGAPLAALVVTEAALSLVRYPTTYEREDPFLGFNSVTSLFRLAPEAGPGGVDVYRSRESKLPWFNEQEFLAEKPDGGFRAFAFGGSTTFGRPYDYRTAFPNWLDVLLSAGDPGTHYEIVNVGGVSYASYRIVNLMNEMAAYEPDLFIVYTGHNEFLEERTYADLRNESPTVTRLRTMLHRTRSYSAARDLWIRFLGRERAAAEERFEMAGEVTAILDQSFGLDQYRRDTVRATAIVRHFQYNLERMVEIADNHDIELVFVVPPANDKDFSPFKSQTCDSLTGEARNRWRRYYEGGLALLARGDAGGAAEALERAREIDACHADLWYRLGKALFALGRHEDAQRAFVEARALDVAPLRATPEIQATVRTVARERGVPVIDLEALLQARRHSRSDHSILGEDEFLDHAHPRIWVHQELAETLVGRLEEQRSVHVDVPLERLDTGELYDSVVSTLDDSYYAVRDLNLAKVLGWLGKREEAAPFVARAAEGLPQHPEAQYIRGVFLQDQGQLTAAEDAYRRAISLDSTFVDAHIALGSIFERTERLEEAIEQYRAAVRFDPQADHAYFALGNALYQAGAGSGAVQAYRRALDLNPRHSRAWNNLAAVHITEGEYQLAIEALEETLELEPQNVSALKNLGISYYNTDRPERARQMFETVQAILPDDEFSRAWLDRLERETGR